MKILAICLLLPGFIQTFCESSTVNRASVNTLSTPKAIVENENAMKENTDKNALQTICQMTLDLPELQKYYHPEAPGRTPVKVIKNSFLKDKISLSKFEKPVEFIEKEEADKKNIPAFEFTSINITDKTATVEFRYAVEGIKGNAEFKFDEKWEVVSKNLVES